MRTFAPPPIDTKVVDHCRHKLGEWFAEVLLWLAAAMQNLPPEWRDRWFVRKACAAVQRRIARNLRWAGMLMRRMLFVAAAARFQRSHPRWKRTKFPRGVAPGLRRLRVSNPPWRSATIGVLSGLHHGSLVERAQRLQRLLARFDILVTRVLAWFEKNWRAPAQGALVINAPQRDVIVHHAMPGVGTPDSS